MTGSGFGGAALKTPENGAVSIYGLSASNGACSGRVNGVQVWNNTQAYSSAATPLLMGAESGGSNPLAGRAFAAFYAAKEITPATRQLIERYCAQISGVTLQ
jgi:hypothetical protein